MALSTGRDLGSLEVDDHSTLNDPIDDSITLEIEFKMKNKKRKLIAAGVLLFVVLLVVIIAATSTGKKAVSNSYEQYMSKKIGSKVSFSEKKKKHANGNANGKRQGYGGSGAGGYGYFTVPTPRPTMQPTKRPTRSPTPAPVTTPTVTPPTAGPPTKQPTWRTPPTPPTTPAPTRDEVKTSMCNGVDVVYPNPKRTLRQIFDACPSNKISNMYGSDGGLFNVKFLGERKVEFGRESSAVGVGFLGFLKQVWKGSPIPQTHYDGSDPYYLLSVGMGNEDVTGKDVRNVLNLANGHRAKEYVRRSKAGVNGKPTALSGVGRTIHIESYEIAWDDKLEAGALSYFFRQRVQMLATSYGSDDALDHFINDFGTHFRSRGVFGGAYGVDYYFPGYGTAKDNAKALGRVLNADMQGCFDSANAGDENPITTDFRGFANEGVQCYPWSEGGDDEAMLSSIEKWETTVSDKPVLLRQELVSLTALFKILGVNGLILSKFADRVAYRAELELRRRNSCLYKQCDKTFSCVMSHCLPGPVPPRWPDSVSYCLPKPNGEICPTLYDEFFPGSWVFWDTENGEDHYKFYQGHDHITSHGLRPEQVNAVKYPTKRNGGIMLHFCCAKEQPSHVQYWPKGTYCLYAFRYVSITYDHAWEFFSIVWDDENDDNQNARSEPHDTFSTVPMGRYDNYSTFTEQTLLCRKDGPQENPIVLPKSLPFYLVQYQEVCQEVYGMYWVHVQVTWDTENDHDPNEQVRWNRLEKIPRNCTEVCEEVCQKIIPPDFCYVGHDKIVLDYCYYQELDTPGPTPSPTPSPIVPTPSPVFPTPPPTTQPPSGPPTKPPTRPPTPVPTRPTPSPIPPTKGPTPSPTFPPTDPPTPPPTKEPVPPTVSPTPEPTGTPTPAPTPPCAFCAKMQGVIIVGLRSVWDDQPWERIFANVECDCVFCTPVPDKNKVLSCPIVEDCDIRLLVGDFMLLERFWKDSPTALRKDDTLFKDVTFFKNDKIVPTDVTNAELLRENTQIDLQHVRTTLVYGGSKRMISYGKAYSKLQRHIAWNRRDIVWSVSHVIPRRRVFRHVEVKWKVEPERRHLAKVFKDVAEELFVMEQNGANTKFKNRAYDSFIKRFGTHYVTHGVFGGTYGVDYYFTGYGTKPEMQVAIIETKNANLIRDFEHNRMHEFGGMPLGGRSFVRGLDGNAEVGPDKKGHSVGGSEYGIRQASSHDHWQQAINDDVSMSSIIEYVHLTSMAELLNTFSEGYVESERIAVYNFFKFRVVSMAHYWLMKHYWCFFLDHSCENKRRHPFLREDVNNAGCQYVTKKRLRTRTELEVCIGQKDRDEGYILRSLDHPFPLTKWCKGAVGGGENPDIPSNFEPFSNSRKGNCPLVAPPPRWPVFFSYCLPKPTGTRDCPKEHFPEYDWNWDYEGEMKRSFDDHRRDKHRLEYVYRANDVYEDKWKNVNPTSLISSVYPWSYAPKDWYPRDNPWAVWLSRRIAWLEADRTRRLRLREDDFLHTSSPVTAGQINAFIDAKILDAQQFKTKQTAPIYGDFLKTYDGSNTGVYDLWPKNKIYVLHQAPFIDFNGWAFWDTEDDQDVKNEMVTYDPTPTHKDVAYLFDYDSRWAAQGVNYFGGFQNHSSPQNWEEFNLLWAPVSKNSYRTGGIRMDYCCTTISEDQVDKATHRLHWPDGHLCIYAHGAIDATAYKFLHGSVGWDCENGKPGYPKKWGNKIYVDPANKVFRKIDELAGQQRLTHSLPTGLYHIQYDGLSEQYISQNILCMKLNTDFNRDIELPRDRPFYLMRYQGQCQRVRGMYHTEVDLKWATEKDHVTEWAPSNNFDKMFIELEMNSWGHAMAFGRRDFIPDGYYGQDKIMIKYCFYQPNIKPVTDPVNQNEWDSVAMNTAGSYVYWFALNPDSLCTATDSPTASPVVVSVTSARGGIGTIP